MNGLPEESRIARVARRFLQTRAEAAKWRNAEHDAYLALRAEMQARNDPIVVDGIFIELGDGDTLLTRPVEVVS